jgi:hypothetical protein
LDASLVSASPAPSKTERPDSFSQRRLLPVNSSHQPSTKALKLSLDSGRSFSSPTRGFSKIAFFRSRDDVVSLPKKAIQYDDES